MSVQFSDRSCDQPPTDNPNSWDRDSSRVALETFSGGRSLSANSLCRGWNPVRVKGEEVGLDFVRDWRYARASLPHHLLVFVSLLSVRVSVRSTEYSVPGSLTILILLRRQPTVKISKPES